MENLVLADHRIPGYGWRLLFKSEDQARYGAFMYAFADVTNGIHAPVWHAGSKVAGNRFGVEFLIQNETLILEISMKVAEMLGVELEFEN